MSFAIRFALNRLFKQLNAAALFIVCVAIFGTIADDIEAKFLPVLGPQKVTPVAPPDTGQLCWRHETEKLRWAQPISFSWLMFVDDATYAVVPREGERGREGILRIRNLPVGPITRVFCVLSPLRLGTEPVIISGMASYKTHGFWLVHQRLVPVTFP